MATLLVGAPGAPPMVPQSLSQGAAKYKPVGVGLVQAAEMAAPLQLAARCHGPAQKQKAGASNSKTPSGAYCAQVKVLYRGARSKILLCVDEVARELVAVKLLRRGKKVRGRGSALRSRVQSITAQPDREALNAYIQKAGKLMFVCVLPSRAENHAHRSSH